MNLAQGAFRFQLFVDVVQEEPQPRKRRSGYWTAVNGCADHERRI
jgi:hypothetical protein